MIYVNIDKPLKKVTVHTNPACPFVSRYMAETPYKGLGTIKRDGGWLTFNDADEMYKHVEVSRFCNGNGYELIACSKC